MLYKYEQDTFIFGSGYVFDLFPLVKYILPMLIINRRRICPAVLLARHIVGTTILSLLWAFSITNSPLPQNNIMEEHRDNTHLLFKPRHEKVAQVLASYYSS